MSSTTRKRTTPSSPTGLHRHGPPPGFRIPPKPKEFDVDKMNVRELRDQHKQNADILAQPTASTSAYVQRLLKQQVHIENRLIQLVGVEAIQIGLRDTKISDDEDMIVDSPPARSEPQPIDTKQRVLARWGPKTPNLSASSTGLTFEEAVRIEQEAHAADQQREREILEKRRRMGLPIPGEVLSNAEKEARLWAFMNFKGSDDELDDDDDNDPDGDDPSTWFEDDQDDGRKGQDIVEPDYEDFSNIIRIDSTRIPQNNFGD